MAESTLATTYEGRILQQAAGLVADRATSCEILEKAGIIWPTEKRDHAAISGVQRLTEALLLDMGGGLVLRALHRQQAVLAPVVVGLQAATQRDPNEVLKKLVDSLLEEASGMSEARFHEVQNAHHTPGSNERVGVELHNYEQAILTIADTILARWERAVTSYAAHHAASVDIADQSAERVEQLTTIRGALQKAKGVRSTVMAQDAVAQHAEYAARGAGLTSADLDLIG